jgi:hypothetical protein
VDQVDERDAGEGQNNRDRENKDERESSSNRELMIASH